MSTPRLNDTPMSDLNRTIKNNKINFVVRYKTDVIFFKKGPCILIFLNEISRLCRVLYGAYLQRIKVVPRYLIPVY